MVLAAGSALIILPDIPTSSPSSCAGDEILLPLPALAALFPRVCEQGVDAGQSQLHTELRSREPCPGGAHTPFPHPRTPVLNVAPSLHPEEHTYILPAPAAEPLDGLSDHGQGLPLRQVQELEVVVEGREGLQGERQEH